MGRRLAQGGRSAVLRSTAHPRLRGRDDELGAPPLAAVATGWPLTGELTEVIYLGAARRSVIRLPDGRDYLALQAAGEADACSLRVGQTLSLSWDDRFATVFPGDQ